MLGCQDFCGHYEWTFHFLRRRFGQQAVRDYWRDAIAADSQIHYRDAAQKEGLLGLYKTWVQTGIDEQCDWFVQLDEQNNLLRLDMHHCPSKGFLLDSNRNADEDYCDHCIGWIAPALHEFGIEVAAHEHNHCGQCYWEIRRSADSQVPVEVEHDIRQTPGWQHGYLDRFEHNNKLPVVENLPECDAGDLVAALLTVDPIPVVLERHNAPSNDTQLIVTADQYVSDQIPNSSIRVIIIGHTPALLNDVAHRYNGAADKPLLLHPYLPNQQPIAFASFGLPRPLPLLPLLIQAGVYKHHPAAEPLGTAEFAALLAKALARFGRVS